MAGIPGKGGQKGRSGRKSKAEELGLERLLNQCWTKKDRKECIVMLATRAKKGDLESVKLLMAYTYGKPKERHEVSGPDGNPLSVVLESAVKKVYGDSDDS